MHTPDGFLTDWICVFLLFASMIPLAYAFKTLRKTITKEKAMHMALFAAVIFAAQMLNFPIADGTSGHLIGAAFAAIILGPEAAVIILASVLIVQALVFGDGGIFSLGANIFNMGVVAGYSANYVYLRLKSFSNSIAVFAASWFSVFAASVAASLELAVSGTTALIPVFFAMVSTHALIGVGEGLITFGLVSYFYSKSRDISFQYITYTTAFAFLLLAAFLPFVSESPDGLERIAINFGFFENAIEVYSAPLPDYTLFASESYLFVLGAGIIGMLATFSVTYCISKYFILFSLR